MCAQPRACVRERACEGVRECVNEGGRMRVCELYRACVSVPSLAFVRVRERA